MVRIFKSFLLALTMILVTGAAAQAQVTVQGVPVEYGLSFQEPATPIMERAVGQFNVLILPLMTAVTIFVLVLLLWTCWRYRERDGHEPNNVTHNTMIEVIWTAVPILILVVMFIPAMRFLYYNENGPDMLINGTNGNEKHAELVMQVTGNQWNWTYEYSCTAMRTALRPTYRASSSLRTCCHRTLCSLTLVATQASSRARPTTTL